jgi:hypothetical protein
LSDSFPWPLVGDVIEIQPAFVVAVHVQSRLVVIASVPDMPSAGAVSAGASAIATSHLAVVGAVTDVDVPVQALQRNHSAQIANGRAPIARTPDASGLPETAWPPHQKPRFRDGVHPRPCRLQWRDEA